MPGLMLVDALATRHNTVGHTLRQYFQEKGIEINMQDMVDEDAAEEALKDFEPPKPKPGVVDNY